MAMSVYTPLFDVAFGHGWYRDGRCRDLAILPTTECLRTMAALGVVFKDFGTGFVTRIDAARVAAAMQQLQSGATPRLTFLLMPKSGAFIGMTSMPIDTNPASQQLYASNARSRALKSGLNLMPTPLYPRAGAVVTFPAASDATLGDASGTVVAAADGASARFDMTGRPAGLYTVAATGNPTTNYVQVPATVGSIGLIELFLTQPAGVDVDPSAFPLSAGSKSVTAVSLAMRFRPRRTVWQYYVVAQGGSDNFTPALDIIGSKIAFDKTSAVLPTGDNAILFTAKRPVQLREDSPYHFALSGQRRAADGGRGGIAIADLPAAPPSPVWPLTGAPVNGVSEIYVYV